MFAILFHLFAKDFNFLLWEGYVVEQFKIFSEVFDKLFCNNKNQIMFNKQIEGKFIHKTKNRKEFIFIN